MENKNNAKPDCCKKTDGKSKGLKQGIIYGLIPHAGCIAFIIFAVLGVTTATAFFKPILANPYFFYILVGLSFVFATISALLYLKKNSSLSASGAKKRWKYISVLYGTTISMNILMFAVVFPYAVNSLPTQTANLNAAQPLSALTLQVSIPCSGHAPLIMGEIKTISGVASVQFKSPNLFDVSYDPTVTSKQEILSLDIFKTYKVVVNSEQAAV